MHIHRDTAAVVDHADGIVGKNGYFYVIGETCQGFVYGVVYYLIYQMMKAACAGIADIH